MSGSIAAASPVSRATVLETSCDLFARQGYRSTSMRDIAEALGVRAPSLYNHVASKQDVLFAIMDTAMDRALDALESALVGAGDVTEELRLATESLVLDFLRYPAEVTICNAEVRSLEPAHHTAIVAKRDAYGARVREIIERGCRTGVFETGSPQLAAYAVLELGNGAKSWFRTGGGYTDLEVARVYGEFALRVVGAPPAPPAG